MTDWCDDRDVLREQYADGENLESRIALHRDYGTADVGLNPWRFDRMAERLDPGDEVLCLGAGPGHLWAENADRVPWTVHVTDASPGMVGTARENVADAGSGFDRAFAVCDAASLPYRSGRFDAVTANHMLYHVPERRRALREMRRVLRPGGFLFATTNGEPHLREVREVMAAVHGETLPTASGSGSRTAAHSSSARSSPSRRSVTTTTSTSPRSSPSCATPSPARSSASRTRPRSAGRSPSGSRTGRSP